MEFTVQINQEGFTGTAKLLFPTREQKMALLRELQTLGYGGGAEGMEELKKLDLAAKMGEVAEQRLLEIDVVHTASGVEIKDKGMLDIYQEGQILVGLISQFLLGGIPLGKTKS